MSLFSREEYWLVRSSYPTDELGTLSESIALGEDLEDGDADRVREAMIELDYFRKLHGVE
jgi:hypothetical protein